MSTPRYAFIVPFCVNSKPSGVSFMESINFFIVKSSFEIRIQSSRYTKIIISVKTNTHGSDRDSTKPLSSKSSFRLLCQFRDAFSNHIKISSVLISILNYLFHDLQGPCWMIIPYKQVHQGQIE